MNQIFALNSSSCSLPLCIFIDSLFHLGFGYFSAMYVFPRPVQPYVTYKLKGYNLIDVPKEERDQVNRNTR